MDHGAARPKHPWEFSEGAVLLMREMAAIGAYISLSPACVLLSLSPACVLVSVAESAVVYVTSLRNSAVRFCLK